MKYRRPNSEATFCKTAVLFFFCAKNSVSIMKGNHTLNRYRIFRVGKMWELASTDLRRKKLYWEKFNTRMRRLKKRAK